MRRLMAVCYMIGANDSCVMLGAALVLPIRSGSDTRCFPASVLILSDACFPSTLHPISQPSAEDTRDGVRVLVEVQANPELRGIVLSGANTLPVSVIQNSFQNQCVL